MTDEEFMAKILSEIADYAEENGMSPDDTIRTIAYNILNLLEFVTFDHYEEDAE